MSFTVTVLEKRPVDSTALAVADAATWGTLSLVDRFSVQVSVADATSASISDVILQSSIDGVIWQDIALAFFDTIAPNSLQQELFFFNASPGGRFTRFAYRLYSGSALVTAIVNGRTRS